MLKFENNNSVYEYPMLFDFPQDFHFFLYFIKLNKKQKQVLRQLS